MSSMAISDCVHTRRLRFKNGKAELKEKRDPDANIDAKCKQTLIHLEHENLVRSVESPLRDQQLPRYIHIHRHREAQAVLLGEHVLDELPVRTVHGHAVTVALGNKDVTIGIYAHTARAAQSSYLEQYFPTLTEHLK